MPQPEPTEQFVCTEFTIPRKNFEERFYLVPYLVAYLVAYFPQTRGKSEVPVSPEPNPLSNLCDERELRRGDREWRVVGHGGLDAADEGDAVAEVFGFAEFDEVVEGLAVE